jgi:hypothetical protein
MKAKTPARSPVSRRQMLVSIPATAMASAPTLANGSISIHVADDPVFAAIEKHRRAVETWRAAPGETHEDDKISNQLLAVERDAWCTWLTTPPTTLAGIVATLEHASHRPYPPDPDYPDEHVYTNLAETGEYVPGDVLEFPTMIAAALRKLLKSELSDA